MTIYSKLCGKISAVVVSVPRSAGRISCQWPIPQQRYARKSMIEPEERPEWFQSPVTNISHTDVQSIHAELVRMHQAAAETINADEVELLQSASAAVKVNQV